MTVSTGDKFDEIHLQSGDIHINWRRRRFAECLFLRRLRISLGLVELGSV